MVTNKLDLVGFRNFLEKKGFIIELPKGQYEVLRAKGKNKDGSKRTVIVYQRGNGSLSVADKDMDLVDMYLRLANNSSQNNMKSDAIREADIFLSTLTGDNYKAKAYALDDIMVAREVIISLYSKYKLIRDEEWG